MALANTSGGARKLQEFQRQINELGEKIQKDKELVKSEADSESAFVEPFLEILGYKPDLRTLKRQYPADFGRAGNEDKVDYAILQDDKVLVLIEVKHHSERLDKHIGQLKKYFAAHIKSCHFGILTNGIEYRFFSNFENDKAMDDKPFFSINLEQNLDERDLKMLKMFARGEIRADEIKDRAECNSYFVQIKAKIADEMKAPSDEFVNLFKKIPRQQLKHNFKEKFKKIIKEAFESAIEDFLQEKNGRKVGGNLGENLKNGVNLNANSKAVSKQKATLKQNSTKKTITLNDEWRFLKPRLVKFPNGSKKSVSSVHSAVQVIINYLQENHAAKLKSAIQSNNFAFIRFGKVEARDGFAVLPFGDFTFVYNASADSLRSAAKRLVNACGLEPSEFEIITN